MPQSTESIKPLRSASPAPGEHLSSPQRRTEVLQDQKAPEDQRDQVHVEEAECSSSLQETARKRKRSEDVEASPSARRQRLDSQSRLSPGQSPSPVSQNKDAPLNGDIPPSYPGEQQSPIAHTEGPDQEDGSISDPVDFWRKHLVWPSSYFESDPSAKMTMTSKPLSRKPSLKELRSDTSKNVYGLKISEMRSESPETRRELFSNRDVEDYFTKHSGPYPSGLPETAEALLQRLKTVEQTVPPFLSEESFAKVYERTRAKHEAKVVVDIGPLVLPRVEQLYYFGDESLKYLTESFDENWSHCIPVIGWNRPKPDYAAGFYWNSAFSDHQHEVLKTLGPDSDCEFFRVTKELCFPFLTAEAKSSTGGSIAEAEKQNVETTIIAMRGVIELFKQAKLEDKIQLQILAFSAVYNNEFISIYAHFADVHHKYPNFYRHNVARFFFPEDKWNSYKFIKNIYKIWAPFHYKRICDAIEVLARTRSVYASSSASSATGNTPKPSSSSATGGAPRHDGSMRPPAPPSASSSGNGRHLTPNTSPNRDAKKPRTLE